MIHDPERNNESNEERGKGGLPGVDLIRKSCTSRTLTWRPSESSLVAVIAQTRAQAQALDGIVCSEVAVGMEISAEMESAEMEPAEVEMGGEIVALGVLT